ncbi:hypothetical protein PABG_05264 [Paracoccidioides brasiliensis Pb03]|nr:hypothetical protein PABG_05264 [Paracoccidioides brasiliensis Pb03]
MSDDSKPKGPVIPSWQLPAPDKTASGITTSTTAPTADGNKTETSSRNTLIEEALRFLKDESIRDAPTDKKISFLETKGLRNDEIQKLLGVSRNPEATSADTTSPTKDFTKSISSSAQAPPQTVTSGTAPPPSPENPSSQSPASAPSSPPIITYPEFILQARKPPPLVTFQGVMNTLYGAAGLASTIYGASHFLLKPMLEELTRARHELAETAQRNLTTLNEKLEKNVSSIPPLLPSTSQDDPKLHHDDDDDDDDADSITSDPTELFHRDIATQTSPILSQTSSTLSTPIEGLDTGDLSSSQKTVYMHTKRLKSISSQLTDFLSDEDSTGILQNTTYDSLWELKSYLDGLIYNNSPYPYMVYNDSSKPVGGNGRSGAKNNEDAIAAFKTEIRSVKGTLLSARNFPAGTGIRSPIPTPGNR